MRTTDPGDAARIELLIAELRLPAIKQVWSSLAAQADKEDWPAGRFLAALAEHEVAERSRRRLERHLAEARLPPGKTLDTFDFEVVPVVSKAQVRALAAGDAWLSNGADLVLFGPPGGGKIHVAAAFGFALVESGWRVLFTRTTDLVQRLQLARRELALEGAIAKLDKIHLLILDDLAYLTSGFDRPPRGPGERSHLAEHTRMGDYDLANRWASGDCQFMAYFDTRFLRTAPGQTSKIGPNFRKTMGFP